MGPVVFNLQMKIFLPFMVAMGLGFWALTSYGGKVENIYGFEAKTSEGTVQKLSEYKGKVLLIVNVASQCGYTKQYSGLQQIFKKYAEQGFAVLAFPCNQFGSQEPGTDSEIKSFCQTNFGVTFPVFSKIDVNGKEAHPLYQWLKSAAPGIAGTESIKWNFTKFLIGRDGRVISRYAPQATPESLSKDIEAALAVK